MRNNIASVSWGDHLVFGEGDGMLNTKKALRRRMLHWRDELSAGILHWRVLRTTLGGHFYTARGYKHPMLRATRDLDWDDFEVVPTLAHDAGMKAYLYVSLFDDGWSLPTKKIREISYHNEMHYQHVSWQSSFSRKHPEYIVNDRTGKIKQWGVASLAYSEVRRHFINRYLNLLEGSDFDGLFICLRSQSKPAEYGDQFGFNEPIGREYQKRYGKNILKEDFEIQKWRDLQGEYLTIFLSELSNALKGTGIQLSIGVPRSEVIGPPLGNWSLQWRKWVKLKLIGDLVINQNSSQCPSMWHPLWPMHRGYDYLQNYIDGRNMPELKVQLDEIYQPTISKHPLNFFIARQWQERNTSEEETLLSHPIVTGLVFSTFRFDNPKAIEKGDWWA